MPCTPKLPAGVPLPRTTGRWGEGHPPVPPRLACLRVPFSPRNGPPPPQGPPWEGDHPPPVPPPHPLPGAWDRTRNPPSPIHEALRPCVPRPHETNRAKTKRWFLPRRPHPILLQKTVPPLRPVPVLGRPLPPHALKRSVNPATSSNTASLQVRTVPCAGASDLVYLPGPPLRKGTRDRLPGSPGRVLPPSWTPTRLPDPATEETTGAATETGEKGETTAEGEVPGETTVTETETAREGAGTTNRTW